ncbi:DNA-3-methyladenine glycosylase 2 family protein [Roseibium litorale]|uniref:DNA-3-methyladenine glycosylase II n=1 Tax=Roseibium litorale TaxID=2803841 RepID=A0ABR9CMR1_9HYPH|nr:DNA-3-methyladenine glycosylase 2 family protein [Roseibium litorale]
MTVIETEDDLERGLAELVALDQRLAPLAKSLAPLPLRRRPADFAGLAHIVTGQLLSIASASAIFARLEQKVVPLDPAGLAGVSDEELLALGMSRAKTATLRAMASACVNGLDPADLASRPADEAHAELCRIKGIGRWTADIFLLFCAGHPDVFPSGDLALQVAAADIFGLEGRPSVKEMDRIAEAWTPWRAVAARLLWAHYRQMKQGKEVLPL